MDRSDGLFAGVSLLHYLVVTPAIHQVIVDQAAGLHVSVDNGAAHKLEASFDQVFAQSIRFSGGCRNLGKVFPAVYDRFSANKTPDVFVKRAEFALDLQKTFGVVDRCQDLEPVPDDAGILEDPLDSGRGKSRDFFVDRSPQMIFYSRFAS